MNTLTMQPGAAPRAAGLWQTHCARFAPLAAIVLAHGLMLYLLQSGMLRQVAHAVLPQVVTITFVAPPPPPRPSAPPKSVELAQRAPAVVPPLPPLLATPQVEPTITQPQAAPRVSEALSAAAPSAASPSSVPAPPAGPKTISGVEYLRAPQPVYPAMARRMGETGVVTLRVLIGEKGLPEQVVVQKSSGSPHLDEAGRQAALRALYKPYLEDGKAVPVYVLVPINFQLG